MKRLNALYAIFFACSISLFAQQTHPSLLSIHEDHVIFSEEDRYREAAGDLTKILAENQVSKPNFWAFRLEDGTYLYVSPAKNSGSLDDNFWQEVIDKAGQEQFNNIMNKFGNTYFSHQDYMVIYHPDKSFKVDEITEEDVYRQWFFYYLYEDKTDEYFKGVDELLALNKPLNVPMGYGLYTNGFGMEGPVVVFMLWGKDIEEFNEKRRKTMELMGEKQQQIRDKMKNCIYKTETKRGWWMKELTYMSAE